MSQLFKLTLFSTRGDSKLVFDFKNMFIFEDEKFLSSNIEIIGKEWPSEELLDKSKNLTELVEDHKFTLSNIVLSSNDLYRLVSSFHNWIENKDSFIIEMSNYNFQNIVISLYALSSSSSDTNHPIFKFKYSGTKVKDIEYTMSLDQSCINLFCDEYLNGIKNIKKKNYRNILIQQIDSTG